MRLLLFYFAGVLIWAAFVRGGPDDNSKSRFEDLRACLLGSAVNSEHIVGREANSTKYEDLNYQWQQHGGQLHPLGYLLPGSTAEVQSAVKCARKLNVRVIPKSGGHSYGKYSFGDYKKKENDEFTLILDLQNMNEVRRLNNTNRAIVGPGTLTGHMAWKLWMADQMLLPIGICPTVGIAGLSLGGGHGYLSRTYGLMMDNLLELEMVNSNGSVLIANNKTNTDLFWALLGAGGSSLGVVTNLVFKIHPSPAQVIYMINTYELSEFPQVFDAWQLFVKTNSRNSISTALHVKDNAIFLEVVAFQEIMYGSDAEFVVKLFNFSFPAPPSTPAANNKSRVSIEHLTYPGFLLKMAHQFGMITDPVINEYADILGVSRHSFGQSYMRAKSFYGKTLIQDKNDLKQMAELVKDLPPKTVLYFLSYGGVVNDIKSNATSFIHRGPDILYHCEMVQYGTLQDDKDDFPWLETFFQTTKKIMKHNESYQNYVDDELQDHLPRYYGTNLGRLIEIKNKYDPDDYFHTPMSIPTRMGDLSTSNADNNQQETRPEMDIGHTEPKPLMNSGSGVVLANYLTLVIVPIFAIVI